jgi:glutaredoxin 3
MSGIEQPGEITLYTLPWCLHCARAKALLGRRGLDFHEVDGSGISDFRRRLADVTGGFTVPQVVIDGTPIGGADRLARLDRIGVLAAIAAREPFPIDHELRRISPRSVARWAAGRMRGRHEASPVRRIPVKLDRAGRVVETQHSDPPNGKEHRDDEGVLRASG